jgi:hypothetical protein
METQKTYKELIESGEWGECWICRDIFKRQVKTARYCYHCHKGFCEGFHGTFEGHGIGVCLGCYKKTRD